jgi:hypothetical protein
LLQSNLRLLQPVSHGVDEKREKAERLEKEVRNEGRGGKSTGGSDTGVCISPFPSLPPFLPPSLPPSLLPSLLPFLLPSPAFSLLPSVPLSLPSPLPSCSGERVGGYTASSRGWLEGQSQHAQRASGDAIIIYTHTLLLLYDAMYFSCFTPSSHVPSYPPSKVVCSSLPLSRRNRQFRCPSLPSSLPPSLSPPPPPVLRNTRPPSLRTTPSSSASLPPWNLPQGH